MDTLLLAQDTWDLMLDANGNIAMAAHPYAIAQDVASACRLFAGELWYDTTQGIPYFQNILGNRPPLNYIKAQIESSALTVPDVVSARCLFATFAGRNLTGQVEIIDITGASHNAHF